MAEKSSDLCQPNKEAHLHTAVVVSYDTEPLEQALLSQRHAALEPPVLNLDIIFTILCFLPTEVVLRLKTMCRAWSQLISDPLFIRAHSSRPAPVTSCFSQKITGFKKTRYCFSPLETSPRFPTMITVIQSRGFKAVSTSYGLVCFRRKKDGVIIVANPATSH